MNKKIKRIISIALAISAFSAIEPSKYLNFMTIKAYARVKGADLEKISLGRGLIDFKSSKTEYTLKLNSSIDELEVRATPKDEDAEVKINGNEVYKSNGYEEVVSLDKGENTVTIKVQNGSKKNTYTITVIRGEIEEEKQIYLDSISLSKGDIDFSKEETSYNINVPSDVKDVSIKAVPEDTDYDVEIDGITAYEDKNYKRTVSLENGDNKVEIKIQDDDEHEKIYTLHINKGAISTSTTNGWILNNGQWSYINEKGNKETSWKQIKGIWYFLDSNGIMKTGWQNVNGQWYYLDLTGAMKTGWIKNSDGKWYYLYDSGAMAKNTVISGYQLDSNGVWIK
ncbi:cadherin-like beta sandwich domain-containing protein [Clostridium sp.]|uniref:cadherin-like beta sandwich domain-containing protein n=1 Tax=Clostridium sp. TaxID=1506 RepID=UPI0025C17E19|nr:cadherin-like beta sandwich domain-containing protein [Clostridium sp.]